MVQEELATTAWFAIRMGPSTFGIFDAFPDESGRQAHLSDRVAAALAEKASDLFTKPPTIEKVDILAAKLPLSLRWISVLGLAVIILHELADGDCEANGIAADIEYRIYLERFETYE